MNIAFTIPSKSLFLVKAVHFAGILSVEEFTEGKENENIKKLYIEGPKYRLSTRIPPLFFILSRYPALIIIFIPIPMKPTLSELTAIRFN